MLIIMLSMLQKEKKELTVINQIAPKPLHSNFVHEDGKSPLWILKFSARLSVSSDLIKEQISHVKRRRKINKNFQKNGCLPLTFVHKNNTHIRSFWAGGENERKKIFSTSTFRLEKAKKILLCSFRNVVVTGTRGSSIIGRHHQMINIFTLLVFVARKRNDWITFSHLFCRQKDLSG